MIIVEYVISVLQMIKGVIMLVYGLYYPMIVGFLSGLRYFNIVSDSDGVDRIQIFRI